MESKSVKIVIIAAVVIGIIAIIGITALVVYTTKSSEPRVVDLNEEEQLEAIDEEQEVENEELIDDETNESTEESNNDSENNENETTDFENSALQRFYNKLKEYEGSEVSGEKVNELIDIIRRNNEQNPDYRIRMLANVQNWDKDNNQAIADSIYKVEFEEDEQTNQINTVKIEDAD